jgi:hypothetical protein
MTAPLLAASFETRASRAPHDEDMSYLRHRRINRPLILFVKIAPLWPQRRSRSGLPRGEIELRLRVV